MSFNNRSDALIELLEELTKEGHEYVLVGGYAVSAFNARFSTDLDIVVAPDSKAEFVQFLERRDFEETDSHAKEWFYDTEVIEYEKRLTPQQPIGFDLLVNGLGCRQTEAQWSFDYLYDHSHQQEVSGGTVTTTARVQLERGLEILESDELKHGFRSDFGASAVSEKTVDALQEYLSAQIDHLS